MIKDEIITSVCINTGLRRADVQSVIESFLNSVTAAMSTGNEVRITGFGTFKPKERAARVGRNPHTGEKVDIPSRIMPVFEAGKDLKNAVCRNK